MTEFSIPLYIYTIFFFIVLVLSLAVWRLKKKVIKTEKKLEFELNDVRAIASVGSTEERMKLRDQDNLDKSKGILEEI